MQLTTKTRYAVSSLAYMAEQIAKKPRRVTLQEISNSQNIPLSYLEQIFNKLRQAKIVTGFKGWDGGYVFNKEPSDVKVIDVLNAVSETIEARSCKGNASDRCQINCKTHKLWEKTNNIILEFLSGVSMKDVLDGRV